jgi:O-acetyl-ADP-ribose deacetylase (regulator of RNase III)
MEIIEGNLLEAPEQIIVHQTNCMGVMGSGIAKQIKEKYSEVFGGYYKYCKESLAEDILGTALICETSDGKLIANVFGQIKYGTDKQYTEYDALRKALEEVRDFAKERELSVALPYKLGCGRAGGDWNIVFDMITEIFADIPCNIYRYEG